MEHTCDEVADVPFSVSLLSLVSLVWSFVAGSVDVAVADVVDIESGSFWVSPPPAPFL